MGRFSKIALSTDEEYTQLKRGPKQNAEVGHFSMPESLLHIVGLVFTVLQAPAGYVLGQWDSFANLLCLFLIATISVECRNSHRYFSGWRSIVKDLTAPS